MTAPPDRCAAYASTVPETSGGSPGRPPEIRRRGGASILGPWDYSAGRRGTASGAVDLGADFSRKFRVGPSNLADTKRRGGARERLALPCFKEEEVHGRAFVAQ